MQTFALPAALGWVAQGCAQTCKEGAIKCGLLHSQEDELRQDTRKGRAARLGGIWPKIDLGTNIKHD